MLVIGIRLTGLRRVKHDLLLHRRIRTDQGTATRGGDHLVAVERQDAITAERTTNLPIKPAAQTFRRILDHRYVIPVGHRHDLINLGRHTIQVNRHDRFGFLARHPDPVLDRLLQQGGIHIPGLRLRVDKDRRRPKVSHRMRRGAEGKTLHQHLVTGSHATSQERQMHRRRSRGKRHNLLVASDKLFQVLLKAIDIWSQRHHPIGVERLLDIPHFPAAHVSQAKVNSFVHIYLVIKIQCAKKRSRQDLAGNK